MKNQLYLGDKLPSFLVTDHLGIELKSDDLIGNSLVLYFYPKDDTPGCITEACSFRDSMSRLDDLNLLVLGISPDNAETHRKFIKKYKLNFSLLCDEDKQVAKLFGAIEEKDIAGQNEERIQRATFIFDATGTLRWFEQPVTVEGHIDRILEAAKSFED